MKNELGRLLEQTRSDAGHSQAHVGARVGVSEKTIARWERGETCPSLKHIGKLAQYLGCKPWEVVEFSDQTIVEEEGDESTA